MSLTKANDGCSGPHRLCKQTPGRTIAHTLLKIAYQVLKSGQPYQDLGADFYTRRESSEQRRAYLLRQLEKLSPGCTQSPSPLRRLPEGTAARRAGPPPG